MEDELVAAIVAAPDDDAPRLVYADWLMQRGDPRGELIAVQCRLAAGDASTEIATRERELRALLEPQLIAPLHAIAFGGFELRRGFVEHAELFRAEIPDELFARAPLLRSIAVRGAIVAGEPPPCLARVHALALDELGASYDIDPARIAAFFASPHLERLRRLDVVRGRLDDASIAALAQVPAPLEHLRLDVSFPYSPLAVDPVRAIIHVTESPARRSLRSLAMVGFGGDPAAVLRRFRYFRPRVDVSTAAAPRRELALAPAFVDLDPDRNIIMAIKLYRECTNAGLAEAKTAVERIIGRA
jgi:uncharacterized protein (TIGR02996 family)